MKYALPIIALLAMATMTGAAALPAAAPPPGCNPASAAGAMDFWVGDWDVSAGGKHAGRNTITRESGGCTIAEHWRAPGESGTSLTYLDPGDHRWHQIYVGNGGGIYHYSGAMVKGALHVTGTIVTPSGRRIPTKMTVTRIDSAHVRQLIERSRDGGKTWAPAFDALYSRLHG